MADITQQFYSRNTKGKKILKISADVKICTSAECVYISFIGEDFFALKEIHTPLKFTERVYIMQDAERIIGHKYKNTSLLETALTHSSYANECKIKDNERLEFLGDSVLSIIISDYIFKKLENVHEGDLTKYRATLVCEQSLNEVAKKISLGRLIRLGKGEEMTGGRNRASIISDAFEAVLASIYLDAGMDTAREWLLNLMSDSITEVLEGKHYGDYKTMLQEAVQKGHTGRVTYAVVGESGQDHQKIFEVEVLIDGVSKAQGMGRSKKEAEQHAAKAALEDLRP